MKELNKKNSNMYRVGIYLRLSDEDKNKKNINDDSESIKNQRNILINEILKHDDWLLIDEYSDEDLSGAGTYRPEFERLIEDCKNKKLDIVFCKSQSRFSRDMEVIEKYLHNKFIEWNIRFISFSDNADTYNLGNKKSRQINGLVNEWFLEDLSNNIKTAFKAKMKNGEFISPFVSYGYDIDSNDSNKLIVDDIAAMNVKEIFNLYLRNYGFLKIAKILNDKNIPSPSFYKHLKGIKLNVVSNRKVEDIKWNHNAIKTILTNEIYVGNLIQGKRTTVSYKNKKIIKKDKSNWVKYENTHEAIIDIETFESVQTRIKNRSRACKKSEKIHILSGKVYCLECGHYLKKNQTSKHDYLVCTSNKNGYENCVNKLSIRYDLLEKIILEQINKQLDMFYNEKKINVKKLKKDDDKEVLLKRKEQLEVKLKEKDKYFKTLYDDRVDGNITLEQFKILKENYLKEQNGIKNMIDDIDKLLLNLNSFKIKSEDNIVKKYKNFNNLNRVLIDEFIEKIEVGKFDLNKKSRVINIKWKF